MEKKLWDLYVSNNQSTVVSILTTAVSSAIGLKYNAAGITLSVVGLLLSETFATGKSPKEKMMDTLVDVCGVSQVVNANTWTGKWSVKNGLLVKQTYTGTSGSTYIYSYDKYNGTDVIKGVKWCRGTWKY